MQFKLCTFAWYYSSFKWHVFYLMFVSCELVLPLKSDIDFFFSWRWLNWSLNKGGYVYARRRWESYSQRLMLAEHGQECVRCLWHTHTVGCYAVKPTPPPPSPHTQYWVPKGEIIHRRVCQSKGGSPSMGAPCPGLPLPTQQALLFRSERRGAGPGPQAEPEANLATLLRQNDFSQRCAVSVPGS